MHTHQMIDELTDRELDQVSGGAVVASTTVGGITFNTYSNGTTSMFWSDGKGGQWALQNDHNGVIHIT